MTREQAAGSAEPRGRSRCRPPRATQIRELAQRLDLRPTEQWGQNFVVEDNTVRKTVRVADAGPDDVVVEVGPGLGSLT